jgi:hypothetical protein
MIVLAALLGLIGCNPCRALCDDVADYAEECGFEVTGDVVSACKEQLAEADDATRDQCASYDDPDELREWWTCDDLADNMTGVVAASAR